MKLLILPIAFLAFKGVSMAITLATIVAVGLWGGNAVTQPYNQPQDVQLSGSVIQAQPSNLQIGENVQ